MFLVVFVGRLRFGFDCFSCFDFTALMFDY